MKKNLNAYRPMIIILLKYIFFCILTAELFYGNIVFAIFGMLFFKSFIKAEKRKNKDRDNIRKNEEFKDMLQSFYSAMEAGYSTENALKEVRKDMLAIYPENSEIIKELQKLVRMEEHNIPVEEIFLEYTSRAGTDDMANFARVFAIAKRSSGDVMSVMKAAIDMITGKNETAIEIMTVTAAKRYEGAVMKTVPYVILVYLRICSPGYVEILYGNAAGIVLMSILLAIYIAAGIISEKINNIVI